MTYSEDRVQLGQPNGISDAIDAGITIAQPQPLQEERFSSLLVPLGAHSVVLDREELADRHLQFPKRKEGKYSVHTSEAFLAYLDKHGTTDSEVWADEAHQKLVAVIDAHGKKNTAWERHRLELELVHSQSWKA